MKRKIMRDKLSIVVLLCIKHNVLKTNGVKYEAYK